MATYWNWELAYDNDSGDNSPQFVGVKTCAAPSVADEALAKKLDRVLKRVGELVFSASSSPGTAAKAGELYKRIVHGNEVITSVIRDFLAKYHAMTSCNSHRLRCSSCNLPLYHGCTHPRGSIAATTPFTRNWGWCSQS